MISNLHNDSVYTSQYLSKGIADELSEALIDVRWFVILMYSLFLDLFKKGAMTVNELRNIGFYLVQDTLAGS